MTKKEGNQLMATKKNDDAAKNMGTGMGVGIALGVAIGSAMDDVGAFRRGDG